MPFMARYDPFSPTLDHPLLNSSPDFSSRNGTFSNRQPFGALGAANNLSFRERIKRIQDIDAEKNQLIEVGRARAGLGSGGTLTSSPGSSVPA